MICRCQQIRAHSSADAHVYASVMGMKEMLHVQELLAWFGEPRRAVCEWIHLLDDLRSYELE